MSASVRTALLLNPGLSSLESEHLDALAALARVRNVPAGALAGGEGPDQEDVWLVLRGCVRVSNVSHTGREFVYEMLGPGSLYGLGNVLRGSAPPAQAHAAGPASVASIDRAALLRLLAERPRLWVPLTALLQRRLSEAFALLGARNAGPLRQRIAQRLLAQLVTCGKAFSAGRGAVLRLNQSDLAAMLGASRSRVNTVLQKMQAEGLLRLRYRGIDLLDRAGLDAAAQGADAPILTRAA